MQVPLTDSRARGYRTRIEADAAIKWINSKKDSAKPFGLCTGPSDATPGHAMEHQTALAELRRVELDSRHSISISVELGSGLYFQLCEPLLLMSVDKKWVVNTP